MEILRVEFPSARRRSCFQHSQDRLPRAGAIPTERKCVAPRRAFLSSPGDMLASRDPPRRPPRERRRCLDLAMREQAGEDAPRCARKKYVAIARRSQLVRAITFPIPRAKFATVDCAVADTRSAAKNALAVWPRSRCCRMETAPDFRASAR